MKARTRWGLGLALAITSLAALAGDNPPPDLMFKETVWGLGTNAQAPEIYTYLFQQINNIPTENIRAAVINVVAVGSLLNTNHVFYNQTIRPLIKDPAAFDKDVLVPCQRCAATGMISTACPKCLGSGRCSNCQGHGIYRSGFSGNSACPWCNGSGRCKNCNGTGALQKTCPTCKGRKGFQNTGQLLAAYRKFVDLLKFELDVPGLAEAIVVIEGDKSVGTGFLTTLEGKKIVLSNAHVFLGNEKVQLKTLNSGVLRYEKVQLAHNRDLAAYLLADDALTNRLALARNLQGQAVGDPIWVLGNSSGGGVVTTIPGKILAMGPDLVEVDAEFVSGNSGSPIISHGQVIGIASFVTRHNEDWINRGTRFSEVRRFGVRVDNVPWSDFEEVNMDKYRQEIALLENARQAIELAVTKIHLSKYYHPNKPTMARMHAQLDVLLANDTWTHKIMENDAQLYVKVIHEILKYWDAQNVLE